jgi:glyoxylase-like metal-dependent hydrolase (beta-lactamase superfamily II)/rhodanese-related sulfurtransferase
MSNYQVTQIEDPYLSHFAYLIIANGNAIAIDPPRNPQKIYDIAAKQQAKIIGVIETHPHADFVSSHLEIHQKTGATIYAHELLGAKYPHIALKDGDIIALNDHIQFKVLHTPGHSPDSICLLLQENKKDMAIFTGDTLFIGDCGRPDLREGVGNIQESREKMASQMYHSLREKVMILGDEVILYPAHGAGSLCGKALKKSNFSTIGEEKKDNWALQALSETDFVQELTTDQPFSPQYFSYDVQLNTMGAPEFKKSIEAVKSIEDNKNLDPKILIIDTRNQIEHEIDIVDGSINLILGGKFETWIGAIVAPHEDFYLLSESTNINQQLIARIASIGYETQCKGFLYSTENLKHMPNSETLDLNDFIANENNYTIIDVRNPKEVKDRKIFTNSLAIPLGELRQRLTEIPTDKPIVVHCAAGYRSAAAFSILKNYIKNGAVYDLGQNIGRF